jgi:energy-coupling factor transporter ATP-binding protein EcfA2
MLLSKLRVRNFLSVNGQCELPIDGRVTVLLGANDHGKSNLLRALEHLNLDTPIRAEEANWDSEEARLDFIFQINDQEAARLTTARDACAAEYAHLLKKEEAATVIDSISVEEEEEEPAIAQAGPLTQAGVVRPLAAPSTVIRPVNTVPQIDEEEDEDAEPRDQSSATVLENLNLLNSLTKPLRQLTLTRDGVDAELSVEGRNINDLPEDLYKIFREMIPRVEIFEAFSGTLQDSVTAAEIEKSESEFLQGIFFYAGLDPLNCQELFKQDDVTDKRLEEASLELDRELRRLWAQGVDLDLHFQLKHRGSSIQLLAKDPAVKSRHARMSKRSAGVTQFFRLSMVLHARRKKNPANSYVYVFDEPGVFLHPKGQKDLLAVFEQLAEDTQIVYATHSLFMLNQNFPERHRLITKSSDTTIVDAKPYRANWRYAVDALGVRLTANILFSPNILLVEGDSDPIYIYELFRVLNHTGDIDADANLLGIMSYSDLPNLRFLLQTFKAENKERLMSVLFDGDQQGKDYQRAVAQLCKGLEVKGLSLEQGTAIEDYCVYPDLFLKAVETTLKSSYEAQAKSIPTDLTDQVKRSWGEFEAKRSKLTQPKTKRQADPAADSQAVIEAQTQTPAVPEDKTERNAGSWFKQLSAELLDGSGASKVALARNYAFFSRERDVKEGLDAKRFQQAKTLLEQVVSTLKLPNVKAKKAIEA